MFLAWALAIQHPASYRIKAVGIIGMNIASRTQDLGTSSGLGKRTIALAGMRFSMSKR
jgi:hypothetical protein